MTLPTRSDSSTSSLPDPAVDATVQAVNWDSILDTLRDTAGATTARWGQQKSGGYNLIRFLHLDDDQVVVRLPLYPDPELSGPMTPEIMDRNVRATASMLASMEYVATCTRIPAPRLIHSCLDPEHDDVHSPYVVLSKVDGVPLSDVWDDMPDAQRDIVLEQVIDILLELSTLRFDKIGSLTKTGDGGWCIVPSLENGDIAEGTYTSGTDQYLAIANKRLQKIRYGRFGNIANEIDYTRHWFMRSLIPCLYDNSLDAQGFPLMHGDFHSQNILVVDVDTRPRITAIIDWDDTSTKSTSSFAQYPLFIVDHPEWPADDPLRPRNVRDQASFNRLLEKAERKKFQDTAPALSRAFASCHGLYMFEQCIHDENMYYVLFWELVHYIFGPDAKERRWDDYTDSLEGGVLKDVVETLAEETDIANEAKEVLGEEVSLAGLNREEFIEVTEKYRERFSAQGKVVPWLNKAIGGSENRRSAHSQKDVGYLN